MLIKKAKRIEELRAGKIMHSWRRISEIICEEFPDEDLSLAGNQLHGSDLCKEAMEVLYQLPLHQIPDEIRQLWDT